MGHRITFRTDRLGTPLTETVTEPDLRTPLELQAGARLVASVARATGKVRRGGGAARQDVNVSVAGGRRIEIKGVDSHRGLPLLVHIEAYRQLNLLRIRSELARRGVTADMVDLPTGRLAWEGSPLVVEAGIVLRGCDFAPLRGALDRGERVAAVRLPGFGGLLSHPTQPGVTFAREFADRVRVIACPEHRPFMIHSDIRDFGLDPREWRELYRQLGAESGDAVVVVWGLERDVDVAAREVAIRAQDALVGVPAETRQAFRDGTNGFERILPGPDRMYPDTDTPPLPIRDSLVNEIGSALPETPWAREERYHQLGIDPGPARRLATAAWADLFDALSPKRGVCARRLAAALAKRIPHHQRLGRSMPDAARLESMVRAIESGDVRAEAMDRIVDEVIRSPAIAAEAIVDRYRGGPGDVGELEDIVQAVVARASELSGKPNDVVSRWAMGRVMPQFLGRIDPRVVRDRLELALARTVPEAAS